MTMGYRKFLDSIRAGTITERLAGYISILIAVIIIIIFLDVILRSLFNKPTIWANEVSQQSFGFIVLLGGAYTFRHGGFISISIFYDRFGHKMRAIVDILTLLCLSIFCLVLVWNGGKIALESVLILEGSHTYWNPPIYFLKLAIPIGALALWLEGLLNYIPKVALQLRQRPVEVKSAR